MVKRPKQTKLNWKNKPKRCRKCAATTFLSSCPSCGEKGTVDVECPFCNEWHGYTTILQHMRSKHPAEYIPAPVARKKKKEKDGTNGTGSGNQSPSSEPGSFYAATSTSHIANGGIKKQKKTRHTVPFMPSNKQLQEILAITTTASNNTPLSIAEVSSNNALYIKLTILASSPIMQQAQQAQQQLIERVAVKKLIMLDTDASFTQFLDAVSDTVKRKVSCNFSSSSFEYATPAHLIKQLAAFQQQQQQQQLQQKQLLQQLLQQKASASTTNQLEQVTAVPAPSLLPHVKQEQNSSPPTVALPQQQQTASMSSIAAQGAQQLGLTGADTAASASEHAMQQDDDDDDDDDINDSRQSMTIADSMDTTMQVSSVVSNSSSSNAAAKIESIEFEEEKGEFVGIESEAEWELAMAMPIELKLQKLHIRVQLSV